MKETPTDSLGLQQSWVNPAMSVENFMMWKRCVGICLTTFCLGCPANNIVGNTFILYGNYVGFPDAITTTDELWVFTFHEGNLFDLTISGTTIPGVYSLGGTPNIVSINDTLYIGDAEFGTLGTTLVLRGGRLFGNFTLLLSDEASENFQEETGYNITGFTGTLSGESAKNDFGNVGVIGETVEAMVAH